MKTISIIVLMAALVSPIGCSSGSSTPPTPPAPKTVEVMVLDWTYNPKQVVINSGDTVRWVAAGASPLHTVDSLAVGAFKSQLGAFAQPGMSYEHTFNQNNVTFEYFCNVHNCNPTCVVGQTEAMRGSVLVGSGAPAPMPGY